MTIADIIAKFGSHRVLADELGLTHNAISKMAARGHIHAHYHAAVVEAAQRLGIPLTAEELDRAHVKGDG